MSFSKREANRFTMQDDDGKGGGQSDAFAKTSGTGASGDRRQHRLKLALRENLTRRKSQARRRSDLASESFNIDDVSPYNDGIKKPGT
jgi:hypothetical protein